LSVGGALHNWMEKLENIPVWLSKIVLAKNFVEAGKGRV
jgi:hypothetical protein